MENKNLCIYPGQFLLPTSDETAWACVACDQYTSEPAYWEEVAMAVGDKPSAYRMILPECYLAQADSRIPGIHAAMERYLGDGTLTSAVNPGFILTERSTGSGARVGLVCLIDLECYDYKPGSKSLIRATEETVESRIPPRMKVRENAALECSHVLMLTDDPMHSVVEPLYQRREELRKLYDFPLMLNGGHLTGYAVESQEDIAGVYKALEVLVSRLDPSNPLLFAVGDGNHSLAAAKACWDKLKTRLTPAETTTHPARFAMVELENIHDDALHFEPIHRVIFGYDGDDLLDDLTKYAACQGAAVALGEGDQDCRVVYEGKEVSLGLSKSKNKLIADSLQTFLDDWMAQHPGVKLDYIHGESAVRELVKGEKAVGFLLPRMDKEQFFPTVISEGTLPRKTFSLGEANEKRFYMETRRLK